MLSLKLEGGSLSLPVENLACLCLRVQVQHETKPGTHLVSSAYSFDFACLLDDATDEYRGSVPLQRFEGFVENPLGHLVSRWFPALKEFQLHRGSKGVDVLFNPDFVQLVYDMPALPFTAIVFNSNQDNMRVRALIDSGLQVEVRDLLPSHQRVKRQVELV